MSAEEPPGPNLRSRAAVVIDFDTGEILFELNAQAPRAPASMTKIMTAFIVYEEITNGNLTFETLVPISQNASRISTSYQGVHLHLNAGQYHDVDTLLHLMMLPSSNGACVAIAEFISGSEEAFVARMNETAERLGMWSEFQNSHGAVDLGHLTDAYSVGRLVSEFITEFPDILRITSLRDYMFMGRNINNTNLLMSRRPFEGADGFKTGTTSAAGYNLASTAYRDGRRIIAVSMGAPSNAHRYDDNIALLEFGFAEAARRDAIRAQTLQQRLEAERIEAEWQEYLRQEALASKINVVVNGREINYNVFPRILYGLSMVSAADFFRALRLQYYIDDYGNILVKTLDGRDILFLPGQDQIFTDGAFIPSYAPQLVEGEIFITIRYAAEALGNIEIRWDDETRTVYADQITQHSAVRSLEDRIVAVRNGDAPPPREPAYEEPQQFQFRGRMFLNRLLVILAAGILGSVCIASVRVIKVRSKQRKK